MTVPIVLDEYESAVAQLSREQVADLRTLVGQRLSITAADAEGEWVIRAGSYVGTVTLGPVRILVRPKVSNANLFHLLEAGGKALEVRAEAFEYGRSDDLASSFATFFARVAEVALARGLPRSYEEHDEDLVGVRGRIDITAQQRRAGLPLPVACRFDEHTADVALNRIVLAAATRLRRLGGVTPSTRAALDSVLARMLDVSPLRSDDLRRPTTFTRLNLHYRPVERLARMVLQGTSLLDVVGEAEAGAFLVNMNKVFEEFVETRLRSFLAGRLDVAGQQTHWLDSGHRVVPLVPDLVFQQAGRPVFVGDSKYKLLLDERRGQNADYYQLLAYATALNVPEGVLVYCHDDGIAPQPIVVEHAGTQLFVRGIRLDGSPSDVDSQLRALAEWVAERCARVPSGAVTWS